MALLRDSNATNELTRRAVCLASAGLAAGVLAGCASAPPAVASTLRLGQSGRWRKLDTVPFRGKQDDVFFATAERGWYVNGAGKIYRTDNAGASWAEQLTRAGTYFRCIGFVDQRGFAGNIGTDYFPGVTDTTPLYRTEDGGATWQPVTAGVSGPAVKGLCSIDVLKTRFINAGVLAERTIIHAGGRVGGPAFLMRSLDGGATWRSSDLSAQAGMLLDVKFFDEANGLLFCGSDADAQRSNGLILQTTDGGSTWREVYRSTRPFELTWKASFASRNVGYATLQSYNPDAAVNQRFVLKTEDGGRSWRELPLVADHAVREFGVAFVNEREGWVGTTTSGFETRDGGLSWARVDMGRAVNKIRVVPGTEPGRYAAYAIGVELWKYEPA
jgi:photosystem II stability/assembly factor-like uncharacterized protein